MTVGIPNTLSELAVVAMDGEPRALDTDIGERLGFSRPSKIRELIKRNEAELLLHGKVLPAVGQASERGGRPSVGYLLNEEQALLIATLSDAPNAPAVRSLLIRTFVAWRRGHLPAEFDMRAVGGMMNGILSRQLTEIVPAMVAAEIANHNFSLRRGKTAGQLWKASGFPPLKGIAAWFGNRLAAVGCQIDGHGRGELGDMTARLFDPDKVGAWLRTGGRLLVEQKIAERKGQGRLRLVG